MGDVSAQHRIQRQVRDTVQGTRWGRCFLRFDRRRFDFVKSERATPTFGMAADQFPLDGILQFANISRPIVKLQTIERPFGQYRLTSKIHLAALTFDKMINERGYVLLPFS
jgi:hypothetical protein